MRNYFDVLNYQFLKKQECLSYREIQRIASAAVGLGVTKLRLTGGEPLLDKKIPDLIARLSKLSGVDDFALTTNGILLADQAEALRSAGLHRITLSLDTLKPDRFQALTRFDELDAVLVGLDRAARIWPQSVKVDSVIIRGVNEDEVVNLLEHGRGLGAEVRFIEYMDVGGATRWSLDDVVPHTEIIQLIEEHYGTVSPVNEQTSAPADRYRLADGTTFGIISSTTAPFCRECDRSRLTADGLWYLCLYAQSGIDLRAPLRDGASVDDLDALIRSAWNRRTDRGAETRLATGNRQPLISVEALQKQPHLEMHTRGG